MSAAWPLATHMSRLAVAFVLVLLVSGCLFPPAEPGDGSGELDDEAAFAMLGPEDLVLDSARQVRSGGIGPGLSMNGAGFESDPVDEDFILPPRLTWFAVTLDWRDDDDSGTNQTHRVHDLDLAVVLHILNEPESEPLWDQKNENGSLGNSDAPVTIDSGADNERFGAANRTVLTATIVPEARAANITWVLTVEYHHLVARNRA